MTSRAERPTSPPCSQARYPWTNWTVSRHMTCTPAALPSAHRSQAPESRVSRRPVACPAGDHLGTTRHAYDQTTRRWQSVVSSSLNATELRKRLNRCPGGQGVAGSNPAVPTRRRRSDRLRASDPGPRSIFGSHHGSHVVYAVSDACLNISSMAAAPLVSAGRISCRYTVGVSVSWSRSPPQGRLRRRARSLRGP